LSVDSPLVIFLLEGLHVLGDVSTDNVLLQGLGVQLLGLDVVTGEPLLVVGNVETTVRSTLQGTEDSVTGGGPLETDVEEDLERPGLVVTLHYSDVQKMASGSSTPRPLFTSHRVSATLTSLGDGHLTIGLGDTLVLLVQAELLEGTTSTEETGGVSRGPVGKTVLDSVSGKLRRGSGAEDKVSLLSRK
jgi:hypothetical protein